MPELNTFSDIFGRSAWPTIEKMGGVEMFNVNADDRSCFIMLGGQEYKIRRAHQRRWHVTASGYCQTFASQWELLAWIGDRL